MVTLDLVLIRSMDIDRAARFYKQLGLDFIEERHAKGPRHLSAMMGELVMEIYPAQALADVDTKTRLGFKTTDFAETMHRLGEFGAEFVEAPHLVYPYRAVVRDPDGRKVEITNRAVAPLADLEEFASRIEEEILSFYQRPAMYVGRIGEFRSIDCLLHMMHHYWAEASRQSERLHDAHLQMMTEEGWGASSPDEWYKRMHPESTDEEIGRYILKFWERISRAVGMKIPDDLA